MKVKANRAIYVDGKLVQRGGITNVEKGHKWFKAGYVTPIYDEDNGGFEDAAEEKAQPQEAPSEGVETAEKFEGEDGQWFATYRGVTFEIRENQVRDDGTLTSGGQKAYEEALNG